MDRYRQLSTQNLLQICRDRSITLSKRATRRRTAIINALLQNDNNEKSALLSTVSTQPNHNNHNNRGRRNKRNRQNRNVNTPPTNNPPISSNTPKISSFNIEYNPSVSTLRFGHSFLQAAYSGDCKELRSILGNEPNLNIHLTMPQFSDNNAILICCDRGHITALQLLVCEFKGDISKTNPISGQSCLHLAAAGDHIECIQFLLKCQLASSSIDGNTDRRKIATVDICDNYGTTPLQMAVAYYSYNAIECLLSYGALMTHFNSQSFESPISAIEKEKNPKLYLSAQKGLTKYRTYLISIISNDGWLSGDVLSLLLDFVLADFKKEIFSFGEQYLTHLSNINTLSH